MNIPDRLEHLLTYNIKQEDHSVFDSDYQEIFQSEGKRKAEYIIKDLIVNAEKNSFPLSAFAYLSIGGADGSEAEAVLLSTPINFAVMIEISDTAAEHARARSKLLLDKGKTLKILQGDATQRLNDALAFLIKLKNENGLHGLVTSAQAVLHELPSRSPNFSLPIFLGKCFGLFRNNAFYGREPIIPEQWPEFIELRIQRVNAERLKQFAILINDKLKITDSPIESVGSNFLYLNRTLAIEVLHKLLRSRSVSEFKYELGEQLTSFDPYEIQTLIEKDLGPGKAKIEPFITEGFDDAWQKSEIVARSVEGGLLSIPNTHARIKAFSIATDQARNNLLDARSGSDENSNPSTATISSQSNLLGQSIVQLEQEFIVARQDRVGKTRRNAIVDIGRRLHVLGVHSYFSREFQIRVWRQLMLEARNLNDYHSAIDGIQSSFSDLLNSELSNLENEHCVHLLAEWAIDFSQTASKRIGLNTIVAQVNKAIKFISSLLSEAQQSSITSQRLSSLLCLRAKCKRALGRLYRRRHQDISKANKIRKSALEDAERAFLVMESTESKLELALCLFSNATSAVNEQAIRGLGLLEQANEESPLPSGYELTKQYRIRYRHEEAIQVFMHLSKVEKYKRRLHANLTYFSSSIIGFYYEKGASNFVVESANQAYQWIEESIEVEHHKAVDIVDLCYLKAICGHQTYEFTKHIEQLKPSADTTWDDVVSMARAAEEESSLDAGLILGLEDAKIWGRIGTFYLDFVHDEEKAIQFYERATRIDPRSPIHHYNIARVFAYHLHDYNSAKTSLLHAMKLKRYSKGWFAANRHHVDSLHEEIQNNQDSTGQE